MIRELELYRKSPKTIEAYVSAVAQLAAYYGRSPEGISVEEIRHWLHVLITQRKSAFSTVNQKLAGIHFFYRHVLGREDLNLRVPAKRSGRLPEPLSRGEIARLLEAAGNTKHRVLLMTTYAGGLRVSELVHLLPQQIHSERMLIRVNQGKGHKDRYTLLSPRLLEQLRGYWREYRPQRWLFEGQVAGVPLAVATAQNPDISGGPRSGRASGRVVEFIACVIPLGRT
jgi:site-specific recombinase XerD